MKYIQLISFLLLLVLCAGGAESIVDSFGAPLAVITFFAVAAVLYVSGEAPQ